MAELVPIVQHEMLIVPALQPHIITALGKCLRLEIPGFKIQAPTPPLNNFRRQRHVYNVNQVSEALETMYPHLKVFPDDYGRDAAISQRAVGGLHHDLFDDTDLANPATTININTCLSGGGGVSFANFGDDPQRAAGEGRLVHEQVLAGMVDPDLADPHVHSTSFAPAESVVWREGGRNTVWHRFDTDPTKDVRSGILTVLFGWERTAEQEEVNYPTGPHATDHP